MNVESILLWATMTFGQVAPPPVEFLGPGHTASWDAVTQDILGQTELIEGYELSILPATSDLNLGGTVIKIIPTGPAGYQGVIVGPLLVALPSGDYRLQVRARDQAGNLGRWSEPLAVKVDATPPAQVRGVKVELRITVTVPSNP